VADEQGGTGEAPVILEVVDHAAIITLNRPAARNALDSATLHLLPLLIARADADDAVDTIILTGTDPAFCAGVDLKELGSTGANLRAGLPDGESIPEYRGPIPPTTKPLIGAINGPAITGGLELALACDFLVASELARFADTHARVGLHSGWGLAVLLPQAVGLRRARQMTATGRFVDAETALAWGLVNHVVSHDELLPFCRSLAADISSMDAVALRELYETYDRIGDLVTGEGWEIEREGIGRLMAVRTFDPSQVAARRDDIIQRGSGQL
jgi:enoyl-CoA hydratase